jgi:hypothetical protein
MLLTVLGSVDAGRAMVESRQQPGVDSAARRVAAQLSGGAINRGGLRCGSTRPCGGVVRELPQ